MPLQIRRGTDAERQNMTVPLAPGEPLYTTDEGFLYVGDGSTPGGILVAGYNDPNAQDAAAAIFTGNNLVHSSINFAYNTSTNLITAAVDLSNYQGSIVATAFQGNVFADDGVTKLINAVDGSLNLNGTVKDHIVPDVNVAYDLGSAALRFRDLYLSGSSIELGAATITATGSAVNLPAGSTVGGVAIGGGSGGGSGGFFGNLTGNVTGNVAGNTSGFHTGDVKGSVFGDDSTILVDAVDGSLRTSGIVLNGSNITASQLNIGTTTNPLTSLFINTQHNQAPVRIYGQIDTFDGSFQGPFTARLGYRGTLASPQTIQNADFISGDIASAYVGNEGIGGTGYAFAGVQGFGHETGTPISNTSNFVKGFWYVSLSDGTSVDFNNSLTFRPNGVLGAPILGAYPKTTIQVNAITPEGGMIVFDTDTNQFKGYNGSAWVVLG